MPFHPAFHLCLAIATEAFKPGIDEGHNSLPGQNSGSRTAHLKEGPVVCLRKADLLLHSSCLGDVICRVEHSGDKGVVVPESRKMAGNNPFSSRRQDRVFKRIVQYRFSGEYLVEPAAFLVTNLF